MSLMPATAHRPEARCHQNSLSPSRTPQKAWSRVSRHQSQRDARRPYRLALVAGLTSLSLLGTGLVLQSSLTDGKLREYTANSVPRSLAVLLHKPGVRESPLLPQSPGVHEPPLLPHNLVFVNRPSYHKALAFTHCHTAYSGCSPCVLPIANGKTFDCVSAATATHSRGFTSQSHAGCLGQHADVAHI